LVGFVPFGRCQGIPAQSTRCEVILAIPYDPEKRFVRLDDATVKIENAYADNVRIDKASASVSAVEKKCDGGASAVANQRRGRPSNNRLPDVVRDRAISLVRERYADFGPTFAAEKLAELHDLKVSRETLRS
jgi:hypothetical protein